MGGLSLRQVALFALAMGATIWGIGEVAKSLHVSWRPRSVAALPASNQPQAAGRPRVARAAHVEPAPRSPQPAPRRPAEPRLLPVDNQARPLRASSQQTDNVRPVNHTVAAQAMLGAAAVGAEDQAETFTVEVRDDPSSAFTSIPLKDADGPKTARIHVSAARFVATYLSQPSDVDLQIVGRSSTRWFKLKQDADTKTWSSELIDFENGPYELKLMAKKAPAKTANVAQLLVRNAPVTITDWDQRTLETAEGAFSFGLRFNTREIVKGTVDSPQSQTAANAVYVIQPLGVDDRAQGNAVLLTGIYTDGSDSLRLTLQNPLPPGSYALQIKLQASGDRIKDSYGNALQGDPNSANVYWERIFHRLVAMQPTVPGSGIRASTGPNVEFPEYTKPRKVPDGFNPSDKVETRVARLYYNRDAHRVAQIINRDVHSYNRAGVDVARQLADKARMDADAATDRRRLTEHRAVQAASETRQAEKELEHAENVLYKTQQQYNQHLQNIQSLDSQIRQENLKPNQGQASELTSQKNDLNSQTASIKESVEAAAQNVQGRAGAVNAKRELEIHLAEELLDHQAKEDRAREDQFRREVAAAHEDPDTYAPGHPNSKDPVKQVSISVVGEGLIQLRGPIKGVNTIRLMINQLDAPVGQTKVAVHTVQINGEHGDRMEIVADRIQKHIDHSRFLTLQSGEMFRKAVSTVAAIKANECGELPGFTQDQRDRKYLDAYFGREFMAELESLDSEFLHTGNKLLSLHSMDTTSLASALFLAALAKNSTRLQILDEFERLCTQELPPAEQRYFEAGLTANLKRRHDKWFCKDKFQMLADNAKFESIRGMFNGEVMGDDTISPIQREFIRLAQIFKSRLIVEREYKQRVMERAVIEERMGDRDQESREARTKENDARKKLASAARGKQKAQREIRQAFAPIEADALALRKQFSEQTNALASISKLLNPTEIARTSFKGNSGSEEKSASVEVDIKKIVENLRKTDPRNAKAIESELDAVIKRHADVRLTSSVQAGRMLRGISEDLQEVLAKHKKLKLPSTHGSNMPVIELEISWRGQRIKFVVPKDRDELSCDPLSASFCKSEVEHDIGEAELIIQELEFFKLPIVMDDLLTAAKEYLKTSRENAKELSQGKGLIEALDPLDKAVRAILTVNAFVEPKVAQVASEIAQISAEIGRDDASLTQALGRLTAIEDRVVSAWRDQDNRTDSTNLFGKVKDELQQLIEADQRMVEAQRDAEASRRPLDHKKFLDMLVDDIEDKYIELLEGTRAHTANVDAYIKRLATNLDDDFNTQFYLPAFRHVRSASRMWDVTLSQVETTSVLANNRAFAKVSPQATMEFDLPKRDILINEAMSGAKATIDSYGALLNDPTFIALGKLKGGQSTASPVNGSGADFSTVRNVLPGLPGEAAERIASQAGPGNPEIGAPLEALIPDPAIYKFETGTGYEIRPVLQPDGQALVFHFNYMYTTNVREPVRADEKHLGRVKRHFIDTDVQLSNYELREVSRYTVALKAARTSRGVPLLEDIPLAGVLFRPLPSDESSLQQNVILAQATIFPTLFDLMGLRWAPAVADLDPLRTSNEEFVVKGRARVLNNRVFDHASSKVDEFLRIPEAERRTDLYRSQETVPRRHPNGYHGPGLNLRDSQLQEGYSPTERPNTESYPSEDKEGSRFLPHRRLYREMSEEPVDGTSVPQGHGYRMEAPVEEVEGKEINNEDTIQSGEASLRRARGASSGPQLIPANREFVPAPPAEPPKTSDAKSSRHPASSWSLKNPFRNGGGAPIEAAQPVDRNVRPASAWSRLQQPATNQRRSASAARGNHELR